VIRENEKHVSMAYTLGRKCAKNCCKQTILVQLIVKDVVTCFFGTRCRMIGLLTLPSYQLLFGNCMVKKLWKYVKPF